EERQDDRRRREHVEDSGQLHRLQRAAGAAGPGRRAGDLGRDEVARSRLGAGNWARGAWRSALGARYSAFGTRHWEARRWALGTRSKSLVKSDLTGRSSYRYAS